VWRIHHTFLGLVTDSRTRGPHRVEDFLDWLTDPGDPERAAEVERETEKRHKAVAVEGRADGVRLTLNGYCDVNRLEVSPELFRRQDREEVLAARLNEAIARARPSASFRFSPVSRRQAPGAVDASRFRRARWNLLDHAAVTRRRHHVRCNRSPMSKIWYVLQDGKKTIAR